MAVWDTGMLCCRGMCVTRSSSHAEGCQVFLTRHRELLCCYAWHPLTPSRVWGHSCGSTRGSAPAHPDTSLSGVKGRACHCFSRCSEPLGSHTGESLGRRWPSLPSCFGNSTHMLPELWVTPAAVWAPRSQLDGNTRRPRVRQPPCVRICTSSAAGATFFTNRRWAGGAEVPGLLPPRHAPCCPHAPKEVFCRCALPRSPPGSHRPALERLQCLAAPAPRPLSYGVWTSIDFSAFLRLHSSVILYYWRYH